MKTQLFRMSLWERITYYWQWNNQWLLGLGCTVAALVALCVLAQWE